MAEQYFRALRVLFGPHEPGYKSDTGMIDNRLQKNKINNGKMI